MPEPDSTLKESVLRQFAHNNIFIETGTAKGEGVQVALNCGFKQIITIEANARVFERACYRFRDESRVICVLGDSGDYLPKLLAGIEEPVTFWIDAHWSTGDPELPNGASNCPVLEDITAIGGHTIKNHTILVDDIRYFRQGIPQWGDVRLGEIMQSIIDINPDYRISFIDGFEPNDILVAVVPEKKKDDERD
jgi:hypothetical protein